MFTVAHALELAVQHHRAGNLPEAEQLYQQILEADPHQVDALHLLGVLAHQRGSSDLAVQYISAALRLRPDYAEAHNNLGLALKAQGRLDEAVAAYRQALHLKPGFSEGHNNLGAALAECGQLEEAAAAYQQALRLRPDYANAHTNLGNVFKDKGELEEAIVCYRRALGIKPDPEQHSNLLYTLNFCAGHNGRAIYEESCRYNELYAEPLAKLILPHRNDPSPERRLRVGYVSPDFYAHVVGRFLLRLLETHDHTKFEIFCYASVRVPDVVTEHCRSHADVWRNALGISDEEVAQMVRQDRIDILVDLTMHMAHNRMLVFARKPAPIQVTYLAYCGTTGLRTIDYRLTDPYLDPPARSAEYYSEQSIRLPETYWCYWPKVQAPPVDALPALQNGYLTFGCLNNFCKVTAPTLEAWRRLLKKTPESRLFLHAKAGSHRDRVRGFLVQEGIAPDRVTFLPRTPDQQYLSSYQRMDIALDPFPYGGGTTTCDALWMGIPVVSLAGQTAVGRGGLSILSNIGLADLVADNVEEYVEIASRLGADLPRLSNLRATLRERMQKSPLMDAPRFARNIEAAYQDMWKKWCSLRS